MLSNDTNSCLRHSTPNVSTARGRAMGLSNYLSCLLQSLHPCCHLRHHHHICTSVRCQGRLRQLLSYAISTVYKRCFSCVSSCSVFIGASLHFHAKPFALFMWLFTSQTSSIDYHPDPGHHFYMYFGLVSLFGFPRATVHASFHWSRTIRQPSLDLSLMNTLQLHCEKLSKKILSKRM